MTGASTNVHSYTSNRLQTIFAGPERGLAIVLLCLLAGLMGGALFGLLGPLLAVIFVVGLVGGLLMLRSTQWGLFALIAVCTLLPFATFPFKLVLTPTFLDAVLVVVFVVWISRIATGEQRDFRASPLGLPVLAFIIMAIVTFIVGLTYAPLTPNVVRHFAEILIAIALFFVVINSVRNRRQLDEVITVLMLAGFAEAALGVVFYVLPRAWTVRALSVLGRVGYPTGWGVLRFIEDDPSQPMRAIATSNDPNVLGGLMILVTVLTTAQLFTRRPLLRRRFVVPMVGVMLLCLYLTYSRGSLLGLAMGLGFLAALKYRRLLIIMALVGVLALLLPQTQAYVQHFIEGIRGQDLATQMRFGEYKDAFILISRYPWLGVGFAGTPDIDTYLGVSNVYLLIAEEMGLVGLGLFLLIITLFFGYTLRVWRRLVGKDERLEAILLGLMASLVGILVGGIFDHYFFNLNFPHSISLFWLYMGLAVAAAALGEET